MLDKAILSNLIKNEIDTTPRRSITDVTVSFQDKRAFLRILEVQIGNEG